MASRSRVLSVFKELHRTCQQVFAEDAVALKASRLRVNQEFKQNKNESDPQKIQECIDCAKDSSRLLKATVVQAKLTDDGSTYEVRITKDTQLENNTLFDPNADIPVRPKRRKKSSDAEKSAQPDCSQTNEKKT